MRLVGANELGWAACDKHVNSNIERKRGDRNDASV